MKTITIYTAPEGIFIVSLCYTASQVFDWWKVNGRNDFEYTAHKDWLFLRGAKTIDKVENKKIKSVSLVGFKLKKPEMESKDIPKEFALKEVGCDYEEGEWEYNSHLQSLYEPVYDEGGTFWVEEEFEVKDKGFIEYSDLSRPKTMKVKVYKGDKWYGGNTVESDIRSFTHYSELDRILTPEFALHERPCAISSYDTYRIIRTFIQDNIDSSVAKITSDYDFCFNVKKKIAVKPYVVKTEITKSDGKSYARPRFNTRKVEYKEQECFEMTHERKGYRNYTVIEGFSGENLEGLVHKVKVYLKELIDFINTPVEECDCCKGTGHIVHKLETNYRWEDL